MQRRLQERRAYERFICPGFERKEACSIRGMCFHGLPLNRGIGGFNAVLCHILPGAATASRYCPSPRVTREKGKIREGILHSDAERVRRTQILKIRAAQAFIRQGLSHERNMHGGIIAPMRKKKEPEWTVALLRCRFRPDSGVKRDPVFRGSSE